MRIKKTLTSLLALWMAALVLYGGAGVNIFSFCCNECRSAGIEAILLDKCCEIHHHQHASVQNNNDKHKHIHACDNHVACHHTAHTSTSAENDTHRQDTPHDGCNMTRIDFDWSVQNSTDLDIDFSPIALDLFHHELLVDASIYTPTINETNAIRSNGPPIDTPRDYLSVLTVLLI